MTMGLDKVVGSAAEAVAPVMVDAGAPAVVVEAPPTEPDAAMTEIGASRSRGLA